MLLSELERTRRHGNVCYFPVLYLLRTMTNYMFCKLRSFALKLRKVTMNVKNNKKIIITEFAKRNQGIATKTF